MSRIVYNEVCFFLIPRKWYAKKKVSCRIPSLNGWIFGAVLRFVALSPWSQKNIWCFNWRFKCRSTFKEAGAYRVRSWQAANSRLGTFIHIWQHWIFIKDKRRHKLVSVQANHVLHVAQPRLKLLDIKFCDKRYGKHVPKMKGLSDLHMNWSLS